MMWKFSFAQSSNIDSLFTREQPPSLEEVLGEPDVLAELKAQNNRLITFLAREDHIKSLLQWVVAGLDELDQQAEQSDIESFEYAVASFPSYSQQVRPVPAPGPGSPPLEPAKMADGAEDEAPYSPDLPAGLGQGLETKGGDDTAKRIRYPQIATEILTSELWSISETIMSHKDNLLRPFWEAVLPPIEPPTHTDEESLSHSRHEQGERERARDEFWSDEDEERHRKRETIRGFWTRVNATLLTKRPQEMVWFIQTIPNVVERMMQHIDSPAIQDMFLRLISAEEGVSGIIEWLASEGLVKRLIALLSPEYPPTTHVIAADLLKITIHICAPQTQPFNPNGGNAQEQAGPGQSKDNRLLRDMVSEESISTMVGFMLDNLELTDRDWKGLDENNVSPADPFVVHPLPSVTSASSSLAQICTILVELIRRNNNDFSEPHLFHTLRNRLMTIKAERLSSGAGQGEDERAIMADAMAEISPTLGIVHLGALVTQITARFGELYEHLIEPKSQDRVASALHTQPLTNQRFRIVELYAELLHSSNMAILNRAPGTGPKYTGQGVLQGLESLELLAEEVDRPGGAEELDPESESEVTEARELPVSTGSTDTSFSESSDAPSDDEDNNATPSQSVSIPTQPDAQPPAPSQADVARLRDVRDAEPSTTTTSDMASVSHAAVATSTAAPSITGSDHPTEGRTEGVRQQDSELSPGDALKQKYLEYRVIPTVIDLFFEYPHNDFAHHVIYDLLQQILNGRLGPGLNRELVIEIIKEGKLVERILDAQRINDRIVAQPRKARLPYMGHIMLIAEELVKFFSRCPQDLWEVIQDSFLPSEWEAFVDGSLRETKDRDARPLAGGKPMQEKEMNADGTPAKDDDDSSDDDDEVGVHKFGEPLTRTMAQDGYARGGEGYEAYEDRNESGDDDDSYWRGVSNRKHVDSSDEDDDDDADWLRPSVRKAARGGDIGSDDDDFAGFQSGLSRVQHLDDFDDDDAWGNFTNAGPSQPAAADNANPFDDFRPDPLTPHDWASEFDREFGNDNWPEGAGGAPTIVVPGSDDEDDEDDGGDTDHISPRPGSTWSFSGDDEGEDLPPTLSPTTDDVARFGDSQDLPVGPAKDATASLSQGMSGLSLSAPRDPAGQIRRSPPPPPPPRASATVSQTPRTDAFFATKPPTPPPSSKPATEPVRDRRPSIEAIPDRSPAVEAIPDRSPAVEAIAIPTSHRRTSSISSAGQAFSPPDASLLQATSPEEPLGPGVSRDAELTEGGMVSREVDGHVVTVPADEIVLGVEDAMERQSQSSEGRSPISG